LNGVGGSQVSNNYNINPNYQIYIGRNRDDTYPRYFNGSIDEVRIYNRSLNSSEVLDLYNLGSAAADIVLAMDFNVAPEVYNGYATYIRDNSVYNNSGVLD
jgi:hypothetical protein